MSRLNSVRINDSIVILSEAKNPSRSKTQDSRAPKAGSAALLKTIDREIRFVVPTATE